MPEVYINDNGSYFNLDTSNWPVYSYTDDSQGYLYDIDDNATPDLIVFPLKINTSGSINDIVQQYTSEIEKTIINNPEQYFWFHKRWKSVRAY